MAEVPPTFDATWFAEHRDLHNEGEDVLSLTNVDVSIDDINNLFGPRLNKNGWKYDTHPNVEMVKLIEKIYCLVTGKNKIYNKQLTMLFAKAIIAK
jgi:glycine cleavage system H lipoate-binding protein